MDEMERAREPADPGRVETLRGLARSRVQELRLSQAAREQAEARYLGGHPALFPAALAAWEERLRSAETIAAMSIRLAELEGVPPPEPDDAETGPARLAELVADLVEPARVATLEKLGEGERAVRLADGWLRTKILDNSESSAPPPRDRS